MGATWDLRSMMGGAGRWLGLLVLPLLVNGLIWLAVVAPQQGQLEQSRQMHAFSTLKPTLEALVTHTHEWLTEWRATSFSHEDPSSVMQRIQRLAGQYHVQIKTLNATTQQATGKGRGAATMPLELDVTGRFSQLAHWISAIETQSGLQIESWALGAQTVNDPTRHLTVKLTAFLQGPST